MSALPTQGPITIEETVGGYSLRAESVGGDYRAVIGSAIQRNPHPKHGGEVSAETARANATLWAGAFGLSVALRIARDRIHSDVCDRECVADCLMATEALTNAGRL